MGDVHVAKSIALSAWRMVNRKWGKRDWGVLHLKRYHLPISPETNGHTFFLRSHNLSLDFDVTLRTGQLFELLNRKDEI